MSVADQAVRTPRPCVFNVVIDALLVYISCHAQAQDDVEKGFAEESGTRRRRRSRVASQTPLKPPTQEELAIQKKQEAHARRVRESLKKYLRRKREALKPKVEAAKKCAGCSLEVFDEDNNTWKHMRVNRVDVKWLEGGADRGVPSCS